MKTDGKTWNAYMASWPEGQWFDDSDETCNGGEMPQTVPDDAVISLTTGIVFQDGTTTKGKDLVAHFNEWLKEQSTIRILVQVDPRHRDALVEFVKTIKGEVLS